MSLDPFMAEVKAVPGLMGEKGNVPAPAGEEWVDVGNDLISRPVCVCVRRRFAGEDGLEGGGTRDTPT